MFSDKELKVARQAIDAACHENEWQNAAVLFFKLLRSRQADFAEFESAGSNGQMPLVPPTKPDYGLTFMPWGKYKDQMFKDIPPGWLMAKRDWIRSAPDTLARWSVLAEAIDAFLDQ
jgi:hypothetical protein